MRIALASSQNYTVGRRAPITKIVLHVMEGFFGPTAAWFANPDAKCSAHYGISASGEVARYVYDSDTAWHAGNGDYNARSIGIELEGHIADGAAVFTQPMMLALTALVDQLCSRYGIIRDRAHILGHDAVPDPRHPEQLGGAGHHRDPGPDFPWKAFMLAIGGSHEAM